MATYRPSRNIEASTIETIETILSDNSYTGVTVVLGVKKVYNIPLDPKQHNAIICVRAGLSIHEGIELGSFTTRRKPLILIDIFATSDGQRLDLKDLLIANLKSGWNYTEYLITDATASADASVGTRTVNGKLRVERIEDTPLNFGFDKSQLDIHDKYRHLISLHCIKSLLEA